MQNAMRTNKGFTLLEAVIAIFLLTVMMLWTIQSMVSAYSLASRNQLRDEAVRLTEEILTDDRNKPFSSFAPGTTPTYTVKRQIRNYDYDYSVDREVITEVPGLAYSITINVQWQHKGTTYNNKSTTIIGDI